MMIRKYIIKERERGYLMKNGRFVELLTAGRYSYLNMLEYEIQTVPMTGEVKTCGIPEEILTKDEKFASRVVKAVLPDKCIALRFVNKVYREIITKPEILYWNVFGRSEFRFIDMTRLYMKDTLPQMYMDLMPSKYYKKIITEDGETGFLYLDNCCEKKLDTGTYYFWNYGREVTCKVFNMKIQQFDISGQEILIADKVVMRLNIICNYQITNPEKLVQTAEGVASQLYTYVQLELQEYAGRYRLDELLGQKGEIGGFVLDKLKECQEEYCVEITGVGIKDTILPGEVREIMDTVLMIKKKTQANVIMRWEEVAPTRSLLSTTRLMDENRTLFKLKETEYLKKICDKVGNISLNGSKGVLEQLAELVGVQDQRYTGITVYRNGNAGLI